MRLMDRDGSGMAPRIAKPVTPPPNHDDQEDAPDFSQMSQDQLVSDPRVPQSFKEKVILDLQRVGFRNFGLKKVSDFGRRDNDDEDTHQRNQRRSLQDWLDSMQFQHLNVELQRFVQEQESAADKEIDAVNQAINILEKQQSKKTSKKRSARIDALKKARESLKDYKAELSDIETQRRASNSARDLQTVAQQATQNAASFNTIQTNAQATRQSVTTVATSSNRVRRAARVSSGKTPILGQAGNHTNNDDDSEEEDSETLSTSTTGGRGSASSSQASAGPAPAPGMP